MGLRTQTKLAGATVRTRPGKVVRLYVTFEANRLPDFGEIRLKIKLDR